MKPEREKLQEMRWGGAAVPRPPSPGGEEGGKGTAQHPHGMLERSTPPTPSSSPPSHGGPRFGARSPPLRQILGGERGNKQLEPYLAGATSLPSISPPQA